MIVVPYTYRLLFWWLVVETEAYYASRIVYLRNQKTRARAREVGFFMYFCALFGRISTALTSMT